MNQYNIGAGSGPVGNGGSTNQLIQSGKSSHYRETPKTIGMSGGVMVNGGQVRVGGMDSIGKH